MYEDRVGRIKLKCSSSYLLLQLVIIITNLKISLIISYLFYKRISTIYNIVTIKCNTYLLTQKNYANVFHSIVN